MRPRGAQALTLEGLVRFLMDRQREKAWNEMKVNSDQVSDVSIILNAHWQPSLPTLNLG